MDFWLVNGALQDAVSPGVQKVDIRVKDGKIIELGKYSGGEKVDVSGLNIYPGLVEAHCHLGLCGWGIRYDGSDYNEKNDCITPELNPIDAINPFDESIRLALAGGVTCVGTGPGSINVLGGSFTAVKTYGRRIDDMIVKEKVAMKCAFGENPKNYHQNKFITSRMTTAAKLRETLFKAREYMEKLDAAEKNPECRKPEFNFKLHSLLPVMRREIPLKAHAHQTNDIFTAIRIAREFGLKLTIEHCTEGHLIADYLAAEGFPLAVGPALNFSGKPETRNKSFATAGILHRAGCQVSIITDSDVVPQENLALCAGLAVRAGMEPFAALQAITINPARHLGIAERVGSIEVGKDADIVICNGDILESSTIVRMVFVNGEMVIEQ